MKDNVWYRTSVAVVATLTQVTVIKPGTGQSRMEQYRVTERDAQSAFENYLGAFAERSAEKREQMLRSNVAEDVAFSNPGVDGRGLDALMTHILRYQTHYPGSHFRINWFRQQHGQMLAEWSQINPDGSEFVTAHSYARLNDEGRIVQFAGFWEPFDNP